MRPQRTLLAAALGVLVLTNAVALGGVAWNRSAQDSALELGARELGVRFQGPWEAEDSSLRLNLQWRTPAPPADPKLPFPGASRYGPPAWLDGAKMRALGFPVGALAPSRMPERWRDRREDAREVLVVLELAGPAWQAAQREAQAHARQLAAADIDGKGQAQADQALADEEQASRLFAVDAGLDRELLRQRWPDRHQYAIVHARVAPFPADTAGHERGGIIQSITADSVTVPHAMRSTLDTLAPAAPRGPGVTPRATRTAPSWTATVAFGRRLEPWLVAVRPDGSR